MSAWRALVSTTWRWRGQGGPGAGTEAPPVFWGHIGAYEAVTRHGMLFLLSPEGLHPSRRVTAAPAFSTASTVEPRRS